MNTKLKKQVQALSDRSSLTAVVMALNGNNPLLKNSEDRAALVRYVEAWNTAKRNPWKMRLARSDAERFSLSNFERVWTWRLAPIGRTPAVERLVDGLERAGKRVHDDVGGAYWAISPTGENCRDIAVMFAGMLLTNPLRGKLSEGPCQRDRCRKWFIKRRNGQKCCSQKCGAIVKTAERVQKQRQDEKKDKLKAVRAALRDWRTSTTRLDWKTWVSKRTGISTKFLTRNFTKEGRAKRRD